MTVIRPNSVSGITSITAQANEINFFRSNGTLAGLQLNGVNFNTTTGVSTFNNLDVGGVLTYQDVTNVDSVGIITARSHIDCNGDLDVDGATTLDGLTVAEASVFNDDIFINVRGKGFKTSDWIITNTTSGNALSFSGGASSGEKLRIDSSGNINIGAKDYNTHSASIDSLQIGYALNLYEDSYSSGNDNYIVLANNLYYDSGNKYMRNDEASRIMMQGGAFYFQNAAAGTAGNAITLVDRLRITSAGRVGINSTSPSTQLEIHTDASAAWKFRINTSVSDGAGFYQRANGDFECVLRDASNNNNFISGNSGGLEFATSGTEKFRIDSNGKVSIASGVYGGGGTAPELYVKGTSGRQMKIHNSNAGTSSLQITNATTGEGEDAGTQLFTQASTGDFYISNQYASGDIAFNTRPSGGSNTKRLTIDSNGYVVHQNGKKCAFNVKGTAMTRNNTNAYVCTFDNDTSSGCFDSGNNFNTSTYKFVAPVSGYYYFFANIRLDSFNSGYIRTAILSTSYHAGTSYWAIPSTGHVIDYYHDPSNLLHISTSTVMYMPATHEAWVYQDPNSDSSFTCALNESSFGGYFIG